MTFAGFNQSISRLFGYNNDQVFDAMIRATLNTTKIIMSELWNDIQSASNRGELIEDWIIDHDLSLLNDGTPTRLNGKPETRVLPTSPYTEACGKTSFPGAWKNRSVAPATNLS